MFGSPWHLTSVPEVPSYAFLAPVVAAVRKALEAEQTTSTKSVPAASSVVGGVPRRSCPVCILKRWIWLLLVLVSHQFLLPVSDRLTNCKVGQTLLSLPLCQLFRRRYRMSLLRPQRCGRVSPHLLPAVVCGVTVFFARAAEAGEPDRFAQICGTERVALIEHCSNTIRLGSSVVL